LQHIRDEYTEINLQRKSGLNGAEPLLETLEIYDRKMWINRHPWESEILLTLDVIERAENSGSKPES